MVHRGTRSRDGKERRFQSWLDYKHEQDVGRGLVLGFSQHDLENGEKIYTLEFESTINLKLKDYYGEVPDRFLRYEYGELLNRFGAL